MITIEITSLQPPGLLPELATASCVPLEDEDVCCDVCVLFEALKGKNTPFLVGVPWSSHVQPFTCNYGCPYLEGFRKKAEDEEHGFITC